MGCGNSSDVDKDKKADETKKPDENNNKDDADKNKDNEGAAAAGGADAAGGAAAAAPAAAAKKEIDWAKLNELLPSDKNDEQKKARYDLFSRFDGNGSGKLSLAEASAQFEVHLKGVVENVSNVINLAFNTAKMAGNKHGVGGDADFVERREFRLLLLYTRNFYELWQLFAQIDQGADDHRLDINEFKKAVPLLKKWGAEIEDADAEASFKECDVNGGGSVMFAEFAAWALKQNLDTPDDDE